MNNLTSTINITIPIDIKDEATELFNSLGLNMNTAINIFLKRSIYERGIPFYVKKPIVNNKVIKAIEKLEKVNNKNISSKKYENVLKLIDDIE